MIQIDYNKAIRKADELNEQGRKLLKARGWKMGGKLFPANGRVRQRMLSSAGRRA